MGHYAGQFLYPESWHDFFVPRGCVIFFVLRGSVIFFSSWEVEWFFLSREVAGFFCPLRLREFFVLRGCVILFVPRGCIKKSGLVLSDLELQTQMDRWESLWVAWKYWNESYWCGGVDKFFVECYVVEIFGIQGLKKESKNVLKLWEKKIPPIPNPQSPIWYPLLGILSPIGY
jgi:hypothetical protein